jgi:hypothetical protein
LAAGIKFLEECFKVGMLERKNERDEFLTGCGKFSDEITIRIAKRHTRRYEIY